MSRKLRWATIAIAIAASLYSMLPLNKKVHLGLDLQGGMHVVLAVDTDAAVDAKIDNIVYQLRRELQDKKIDFSYLQKVQPYNVQIGIENSSEIKKINEIAKKYYLKVVKQDTNLVLTLDKDEITRIKENAVLQSLEVVRNRIDAFGVSEPLIQKQGAEQILVQLPGITDPDRAINLIGQTAQLMFYLVDETVTPSDLASGYVPFDDIVLTLKETNTPIALKREVLLTGDSLLDAGVQYNQFNEPVVSFSFDPSGARVFAEITAQNRGKRLAIVLDDKVYSAPSINEKIPNGQGIISGNFTIDSAKDLAIVLRAGSLPAPVTIEENRTVGPSLGQDSINSGVKACLIGVSIIALFMIVYYRLSGLVANIGLLCNFIILLGILCALKATLTLPGIAGIILTLGIAVDSNVLIFERVREELRNGRTVLNAFELGYQKAFATIVDANLTSLIASLVLFQFGTGPVKGFAVTLSLGLIASMFTAVFITKTIFLEFIIRSNSKNISI